MHHYNKRSIVLPFFAIACAILSAEPLNQAVPVGSMAIPMINVEGGAFIMGNSLLGRNADEKNEHKVELDSFQIGATEITQSQWKKVMGSTPRELRDRGSSNWPLRGEGDDVPMYYASWYDAVAFCNNLSISEGLEPAYSIVGTSVTWNRGADGYRLPTEAEWEYAAKGGPDQQGNDVRYAGSDDLDEVAWYYKNCNSMNNEVATKAPNRIGLYDMSGNVWEWCWDVYQEYGDSMQDNPSGAESGELRISRGGHWYGEPDGALVFARGRNKPDLIGLTSGFRVARSKQ